jgi:hypothetical protein
LLVHNVDLWGDMVSQISTCIAHEEDNCPTLDECSHGDQSRQWYRGFGNHQTAHMLLQTQQKYRGPLREVVPVLQHFRDRTTGYSNTKDAVSRAVVHQSGALFKEVHAPGFGEVQFPRTSVTLRTWLDLDNASDMK